MKYPIQTVKDTLPGWEHDFVVPTQFSQSTMFAISNGRLDFSSRSEIVQNTVAKMQSYCKYPSSIQKKVVASKIVDMVGSGSKDCLGIGHVSSFTYINMIIAICYIRTLGLNPLKTGLNIFIDGHWSYVSLQRVSQSGLRKKRKELYMMVVPARYRQAKICYWTLQLLIEYRFFILIILYML